MIFFFLFFASAYREEESLPVCSSRPLLFAASLPPLDPPDSLLRNRHSESFSATTALQPGNAGPRRRFAGQSESLSMLSIPFRPRFFCCFLGHFFSRTSYLLLVTSVSHAPGQMNCANRQTQRREKSCQLRLTSPAGGQPPASARVSRLWPPRPPVRPRGPAPVTPRPHTWPPRPPVRPPAHQLVRSALCRDGTRCSSGCWITSTRINHRHMPLPCCLKV